MIHSIASYFAYIAELNAIQGTALPLCSHFACLSHTACFVAQSALYPQLILFPESHAEKYIVMCRSHRAGVQAANVKAKALLTLSKAKVECSLLLLIHHLAGNFLSLIGIAEPQSPDSSSRRTLQVTFTCDKCGNLQLFVSC